MTDKLLDQARALGDPTRNRIYRYIDDAEAPVGVAELTDLLECNHNAVRQHLRKLREASLIAELREKRTRPGRPRLLYVIRTDSGERWRRGGGAYQRLAIMLLDLHRTGGPAYDVGRRTAIALREDRKSEPSVEELTLMLARDGFAPELSEEAGTIILGNCPFEQVALMDAETVCEIHRGLIDGELARTEGKDGVRLIAMNPSLAGCEVLVGDCAAGCA